MEIKTTRLRLIPFSPEHLLALIEGTERFAERFSLRAADGLREFFVSADVSPGWLAQLRASSAADPWTHGFAAVHRASSAVIGSVGFKGPPNEVGMVEIAYGIVPGFQCQGYATEAAAAGVTFAFASGRVRLVWAHTLPTNNASTRVLTKCGFTRTDEVEDPEDGLVWRRELLPDEMRMLGDAYTFELAWRWTRPTHNVLPPDVMAQINPLDGATLPDGLVRDERHLDATALVDIRRRRADASAEETADWLRRLPVAASEQVVVRWPYLEIAVATNWDVFTRFWDDFCYPSSDDVEVFPPSGKWLLLYHHFEEFEWGHLDET
jgi:RimJ/RimL family protein N-acetyltransferase